MFVCYFNCPQVPREAGEEEEEEEEGGGEFSLVVN